MKYNNSFLQPFHMIAQHTSFTVLVAAFLINTLSYCSSENVYCVTPTATSCSSCPYNTHCATLSEYAQKAELYFTSNTIIVFLPGEHALDVNITVANITRLTMLGESFSGYVATVVHKGPVGFNFTNMMYFNIYSLAFTSFNRSRSYGSHRNFAMLLQSTHYAKLVNCSFHDNLGTALTVHNTNVTLTETKFMHNQCACQPFSDIRELGCSITTFKSNLIFTGSTTFRNNTQTASYPSFYCAGAIWASASSIHFNGTSNFICNTAKGVSSFGGAINAETNTLLTFSGTSNFTHNSAEVGGAISTFHNVAVIFSGTNNFISNKANDYGGAIYAENNTSLSFHGTNKFSHNSAEQFGGAITTAYNVVITFNGTNTFFSNLAERHGGAFVPLYNTVVNFNGNNSFINNSAGNGGAISTNDNGVLTFNGTNNFFNNSAEQHGGSVRAQNNISLIFTGFSSFIHNVAADFGGAIYAENVMLTFDGTTKFFNNSVNNSSGGAIHAVINISLGFIGTSTFSQNSAGYEGGAISTVDNVVLTFNGTNNFTNNSAKNGGAFFAVVNTLSRFTGTTSFCNNMAMQGGAILANSNSELTFNGNISFTKNGHNKRDSHGGPMYLAIGSTLSLLPHTTVYWDNNYANLGGAIYVLTENPFISCKMTQIATFLCKDCFFQLPDQNWSSDLDVQLVFKNNSADDAGSVLYGGAIDDCGLDPYYSSKLFDKLVQYEDNNTTSSISSDPFRICFCENNSPNCGKSMETLSVYPGETFQISVASVGQRNGIVPSAVSSHLNIGRLMTSQYIQQSTKTCTVFNYTVFSQQDVSLELYPEGPCSTVSDTLLLQLSMNQGCPPGFSLENSSVSCVCDRALQKYTNRCNITNGLGQISRESGETFWVGYDQSFGLTVHPHCPFDNCVSHAVNFSLNNTDMQCAHNRSGLLCGACKDNYSLVLGISHCKRCTNYHLYLLISFAVMGVVLVFFLLICKLTVATGTLSGLVFYTNIVGINHNIFLPVESTDVFSVFIAWVNLDFGIDTCFYNGLDAYSNTWLQFVFPVYIWLLVGLMILVSHYSQSFANLLGNNPVSVLATLILLSYAKILHTLIIVVSFSNFEYPDSHHKRWVWVYDANIDYLVGKHIPLFIVAVLVFFFLFLPYTLLLLFGQWLQAISHLRLFSWVNSARLKPFMDSYHASYKPKHRYWPGLLLVLRFVLLLVFAFNRQQDPSINLLAILVGTGSLQVWILVSGGVYNNWCLDALEASFTLNLIILVGTTYHVNYSGGNQLVVGYTSAIIALTTFIAIIAYHIFQQLRHTKLWMKVTKPKFKKRNTKQTVNNLNSDTTGFVNIDQLREPWLEDLSQPTHTSY